MEPLKLKYSVSYFRLFILSLIFIFLFSSCSDNNSITIGQSPLLRFIEPKSGKIVFMSSDGNIYTADQTGGNIVSITNNADLNNATNNELQYYQFPSWSPNGSRIAYIGIENRLQQDPVYSLFTSNSDGSNRTKIFSSNKYLPRNIYWSSDSRKITFLTSEIGNSASTLQIASVTGDGNTRIDAGTPFFWSWAPNNKTIVVHVPPSALQVYSRLAFLNLDETFYEQSFPFKAGMFQSPAWSPDGNQILVAALSETQSDLILTDQNSSLYQKIHSSKGSLLFTWSPDGNHIAYIERLTEQDQNTSSLSIVKTTPTDSKNSKLIDDKYILAFFWSPDNNLIAFFVPSMLANSEDPEQQTLVLTLFMYDLKKNTTREINTFIPTVQFLAVIQQFDHYYQTSRLWSPDSRNILYSALTEGGPKILIAKAEGNIAPRQVIEGYLGFWSWD